MNRKEKVGKLTMLSSHPHNGPPPVDGVDGIEKIFERMGALGERLIPVNCLLHETETTF